MAVDVGTLVMKFEADNKKLDKGFASAKKGLTGIVKAAKVAAVATTAALTGIAVKSIKLAADQEKAEARLESIAKKVTNATDDQVRSLKDLAAATQEVSTFGDEVLITGQSQLLSFGLQADQVEQLTGSLADLLAANNGITASEEDAINAANLLGKAFDGQAGALSRVGILLDDTQAEVLKNGTAAEKTAQLVAIMDQNYGGLAETLSQTTAGQLQQAKNSLGDVGEVIGAKLLPIFNDMLSWVMDNMPQIESFFSKAFDVILDVTGAVSTFIKDTLVPIFTSLFDFISDSAPEGESIFKTAFNNIKEVMSNVWEFIEENLLPIFKDMFDWVDENMPTIEALIDSAFTIAKDVISATVDIVGDLWEIFKTMWEIVEPILIEMAPAFETAFDGALITVASLVSSLKDFISSFKEAKSLLDIGDPFYQGAVNLVEDLFGEKGRQFKEALQGSSIYKGTPSNFNPDNNPRSSRAQGGNVTAGMPYLVNEGTANSEVFTPSSNGTISKGMMGNITINVEGSKDPELVAEEIVRLLHEQGVN